MERPDRYMPMGDFASNYGDAIMDRQTPNAARERISSRPQKPCEEPRTLDSESLFNGERELRIMHGDACYRLTITRLNKLILTK